jgi:hypothetical protein
MALPIAYLTPDNDFTLTLEQVRNDGKLNFSLTLEVDTDGYLDGRNIIDALILFSLDLDVLFADNPLPIHAGATVNTPLDPL